MGARIIADVVVTLHLAFILFVGLGGLLAWRWPRVVWFHVPTAIYGVAIIAIGFDCPLTPLEKHFRRLAGEGGYEGGFVDHYLKGVVYPGGATPLLQAVGALAVGIGYAGWWRQRRRETLESPSRAQAAAEPVAARR